MTKELKTVAFKEGERNVFLHILTACNLSCSHCYINKDQHGTETISNKTMLKWLDLFHDPEKTSNIIFLGGEPTLHKGLAQGASYAKSLGYNVTIDSNGYLFNNILEESSPSVIDFLSFSLDGPDKQTNDPIRGDGVFEVCTNNIRKAVSAGYNVSVIYTVSRKNIEQLPRMVGLLKELSVPKFFIQVLGLRGNSSNSEDEANQQVSKNQWLSIVPDVAKDAADHGIHVTYPKVFLDDGEQFQCAGVVAENFFVFPNGRVYQCPLCEDHPIHSYNIVGGELVENKSLNEKDFFALNIPEGCVMNKLLQPDNIEYNDQGEPVNKISCCLLKQEIGY